MNIFYTDVFVLPLPEGHKFPMDKYARLRHAVAGADWVAGHELHIPPRATDDQILVAHDPGYLARVCAGELTRQEVRRIGFPWSPELVERSRRSAGATIEACRSALRDGFAVNLAGGTHHAFRDSGEGFCVFNDSVIAARVLQGERRVRRVLILDCDVHQGNGSAALAAGDDSLFTFSIHGARNFPFRKEVSDLDIALEDATQDNDYLGALERGVVASVEASRADLAIYLAGADPWSGDRWGRLALTKSGLARRDRLVFDLLERAGIPLAVTMAGGYAPRVEDIVDIHLQTVREAALRAPGG